MEASGMLVLRVGRGAVGMLFVRAGAGIRLAHGSVLVFGIMSLIFVWTREVGD
jgi:hypothetical protein